MKQSVNIQDQFLNQLRKDGNKLYSLFIKWFPDKGSGKGI